mmetsp:Transcript_18229/g.55873  ORF Transcript_18229/g.55873 Transcript_18229/m.55873 type:complete len:279 (-) Transcript_18229:20-856(-)
MSSSSSETLLLERGALLLRRKEAELFLAHGGGEGLVEGDGVFSARFGPGLWLAGGLAEQLPVRQTEGLLNFGEFRLLPGVAGLLLGEALVHGGHDFHELDLDRSQIFEFNSQSVHLAARFVHGHRALALRRVPVVRAPFRLHALPLLLLFRKHGRVRSGRRLPRRFVALRVVPVGVLRLGVHVRLPLVLGVVVDLDPFPVVLLFFLGGLDCGCFFFFFFLSGDNDDGRRLLEHRGDVRFRRRRVPRPLGRQNLRRRLAADHRELARRAQHQRRHHQGF